MGKLLPFIPTRKTLLRQAEKEIKKMYALTGGGRDPVVSEESQAAFEEGFIDEVVLERWSDYCERVLSTR